MIVEGKEKTKGAPRILRQEARCEPLMARFLHKTHGYSAQYAALYYYRLKALQPELLKSVEQRWCIEEGLPIVDRILQLTVGMKCVVAGTLFKEMPLRPNILKSYAEEVCIICVNSNTDS